MITAQPDLFERAKNGGAEAFGALIQPFEGMVYNIAYRMLANREDARDISQEVWIKVYKNISRCKSAQSFASWLCAITNNACLDALRKQKARIQPFPISNREKEEDVIPDKKQPLPEDELAAAERRKAIQDALDSLSPAHKSMIVYRDIQGFSYEEISEMTGYAIGTVKSRISRARNSMKKILTDKECFY